MEEGVLQYLMDEYTPTKERGVTVLVDDHEPKGAVQRFKGFQFNVIVQHLPLGDYVICGDPLLIFERKGLSKGRDGVWRHDFLSSLYTRDGAGIRLYKQLGRLLEFRRFCYGIGKKCQVALIAEDPSRLMALAEKSGHDILKTFYKILFELRIPIIETRDLEETVKRLSYWAIISQMEFGRRPPSIAKLYRKSANIDFKRVCVVASTPHYSLTRGKIALAKAGSVANWVNWTPDQHAAIRGISPPQGRWLYNFLTGKYKEGRTT